MQDLCVLQARFWHLKKASAPNGNPRCAVEDTTKTTQRSKIKNVRFHWKSVVLAAAQPRSIGKHNTAGPSENPVQHAHGKENCDDCLQDCAL